MFTMQWLKNYYQMIQSESFAKYEKDFSYKIECSLCGSYRQGNDEPKTVQEIVNAVNGEKISVNSNCQISSHSIFIHGNKSQVAFKYYDKAAQRELGDLIFIIAIVFGGKKYFERMTITQFKKDSRKALTWSFKKEDMEQLYLLSRFPKFKGIGKGSLIPQKEYPLSNNSSCLGSYGMLHTPGDFVFLGAPRFEAALGNKKVIKINDLYYLRGWADVCRWPFRSLMDDEAFAEICPIACSCNSNNNFQMPCYIQPLRLFKNVTYAQNVYDFTDKYLRFYIGEFTHADIGIFNQEAKKMLLDIITAIEKKAKKNNDDNIKDFVSSFRQHSYSHNDDEAKETEGKEPDFDSESGGIGIIYTAVDLGRED